MVAALLLAGVLAADRASPLDAPAPSRPERGPGRAAVVYATSARAYLDAGAEDGLVEGGEVEVRRAGEVVGRCRVELVAPHQASCAGIRARVGDAVRFDPAPAAALAPASVAKELPPPPDDAELARRLAAVSAAPAAPLVQYEAPARGPDAEAVRRRTGEVALTHASWVASGSSGSHREALDVVLRGADVGDGLTLDVDARAERWVHRDAPRFRPKDDTQLYLWQAQLTATPADALVLSAGRVLPFAIPGATIFDGALAGVRRGTGSALRSELGIFGGLVPDPVTTGPTARRSTGGGYWILDGTLGHGASFRQEGRVAFVHAPELGTRTEASLAGRLFVAAADLSAEAHLGAGGTAKAGLDAGRIDATARPAAGVLVGGSLWVSGVTWPQPFEPPVYPGRSRAADLFASVDVPFGLRAGGVAGHSKDLGSGLDRTWIGPELAAPRLLGPRGGVAVGYLEEVGWLRGRSAYAQLSARPWQPLRLLARASWTHDQGAGIDRDELGLAVSAAADLTARLGLRVSLLSRAGVGLSDGGPGSTPLGVSGFASLVLAL